MKQLNLLKTLFLLCALMVGSTSAWADIESPWSHTFSTTAKTFTADGTQSLSGVDWTLAVTWASSNTDYNVDSNKGMKIGSNSKYPISMTLSTSGITGTITKVSVSTCGRSGGSCAVGVKVGSTDFTTTESWGAATMTTMDFTGEASGTIEISWDQSAAPNNKKGAFYVKDITVEFETGGGGDKETATWTVSPASATVAAGQTTVLDLTTNYDGALNFESEDNETATVSYNSSTKKITITGVAKGATKINVTGAATDTYKSISKKIDVTVTRGHVLGEALYEGVSSYTGSSDVSTALTVDNAYLDYKGWASFTKVYPGKVLSGDVDGHLKFGSSSDKGTAVTKSLAIHGNATLTYKVQRYDSSNEGNLKISVTGATAAGDVDVTGTAEWVTKTVNITGGKGNVVITFETTSSDTRIRVDDILLVQDEASVTITTAEYATFVSACNLDFSATGITAYTATAGASSVALNEIASGKVPANTPVVLYKAGADGTAINVPVIASADAVGSNDLVKSIGSEPTNAYVLANKSHGVGFYKWAGGSLTSGKVYLQGTSSARDFLGFGDATGIDAVKAQTIESQVVYNLAGQRVAQPTKGLYIVNGKKIVIK